MSKGKAKPVPEGYHAVTPYLVVDGAAKALDFYGRVFGATERMRMPGPGGKIGHAEISIGDSVIMLADEHPEMGARGPRAYGGAAVSLHLYVPDVDETVKKAQCSRRQAGPPRGGQVLRRPHGQHRGSVRASLARVDAQGRRVPRRDGAPRGRGEQAQLAAARPEATGEPGVHRSPSRARA